MSLRVCVCVSLRVCVCVCVCVPKHVCVFVCLCVNIQVVYFAIYEFIEQYSNLIIDSDICSATAEFSFYYSVSIAFILGSYKTYQIDLSLIPAILFRSFSSMTV